MRFLFALLLFAIAGCDSKPDLEWTKGGSLHNQTLAEWRKADDKNKLATCADFAANIKKANHQKFQSVTEMKAAATELKACIDEVAKGGNDLEKISEIAIGCYVVNK